ncbi:NAD(P)-binding protein [Plasmodium yoelii yoelii]|nr:NAD(P)-binding protein [Plasmodium yoelii yoelii]
MTKRGVNIKINIIQCNLALKESINEAFDNVLMNKSLDKNRDESNNIHDNNIHFRNKKIKNEELNPNNINIIDVLICNAAYVSTNENEKLQLSDLLYTINTNIYGNIDFISKAVLHMKNKKIAIKREQIQSNEKDKNNKISKQNERPRGGMILFINSEGALYPVYGYSYYLMSKSCMWTYNNILDQELKHFNIHIVNAFLPSIETPGYVQENLTKPLITKKIEDLTTTLNSDYAAKKVIDKIKQGKKFITLDMNGFFLSILHSGYRNPDCYFEYLISVSLGGLLVFVSSLYKVYIEYIIYTNK